MARTWVAHKATLPPCPSGAHSDGCPTSRAHGADRAEREAMTSKSTGKWMSPRRRRKAVSDPPDGKIQQRVGTGAAQRKSRRTFSRMAGESGQRLYADPASCCFTMIGPRGAVGEIIQQAGRVIMVTARVHRVIPTDGRPHVGGQAKFFRGNSRGRWDGDTLVVEVTGLNGKHWFDSVGNIYSENTRMTERFQDGRREHHRLRAHGGRSDHVYAAVEDELPDETRRHWRTTPPGKCAWRNTVTVDPDPHARCGRTRATKASGTPSPSCTSSVSSGSGASRRQVGRCTEPELGRVL